jgi:hypothetical protein
MQTQRMTIHRALAELKLIDSKIEKQIDEIVPVGIFQKGKLINNHIKEEDFSKSAISKFDSVNDLIMRKNLIKSAIIEANSITKVQVSGKEMTIADAINHKTIIKFKRNLLDTLKSRQKQSFAQLNQQNLAIEQNLQKILEATFGKENVKVGKDDFEAVRKPYMEANEYHLFDPLNVSKKIEEIENEVEAFEMEVDAVLSEINAITIIEI